jgi:hypothetical protein
LAGATSASWSEKADRVAVKPTAKAQTRHREKPIMTRIIVKARPPRLNNAESSGQSF